MKHMLLNKMADIVNHFIREFKPYHKRARNLFAQGFVIIKGDGFDFLCAAVFFFAVEYSFADKPFCGRLTDIVKEGGQAHIKL